VTERGGIRGRDRCEQGAIRLPVVLLAGAVAVLAVALVVNLTADGGSPGSAADDGRVETPQLDPESRLAGTAVPEFTVERIDGGVDQAFSEYQDGRPIVVNFFASWCAPCVAEMPDLQAVSEEVAGEVAFLGLAVRDREDDTLDLVEETGVTYDIGRDPERDIVLAFEGLAMPTTAFVDADGIITSVHSGELDAAELRTRIDDELR
jgi:cytochrome c biogenesis protein CcmG/thiol:disulfide interchange protein DsbE